MRKKVFLLAVASLFVGILAAQDKSQGKIDFDLTMILPEDLKAMLGPDTPFGDRTMQKTVLYFNGSKTRYADDDAKMDLQTISGALAAEANAIGGKLTFYRDNKTCWKLVEKDDEKTLVLLKWDTTLVYKPGTRTKEILGFPCREVIVEGKGKTTTLWVTDALPAPIGGGVKIVDKGVVLGAESPAYELIATAISFCPVKDEEVSIPANVPVTEEDK